METILFVPDTVTISWIAPDNRGSDILGYYILIQKRNGTFTSDLINCDGST